MEDHIAVVAVLGVRCEVLNGLGDLLWVQLTVYFTLTCVEHDLARKSELFHLLLRCVLIEIVRLFIEYIASNLVELWVAGLLPREQVESVLLEGRTDDRWVRSVLRVVLTRAHPLLDWVLVLIDYGLEEPLLLLTFTDYSSKFSCFQVVQFNSKAARGAKEGQRFIERQVWEHLVL